MKSVNGEVDHKRGCLVLQSLQRQRQNSELKELWILLGVHLMC